MLERGDFIHDFTALGEAAREVLARWRPYLALFYVDAVEFDGRHIQRFYASLAQRFAHFAEAHRTSLALDTHFRDDVPPGAALVFATRVFIYYFSVESLFGVEQQLGLPTADAVQLIGGILQRGMMRDAAR